MIHFDRFITHSQSVDVINYEPGSLDVQLSSRKNSPSTPKPSRWAPSQEEQELSKRGRPFHFEGI